MRPTTLFVGILIVIALALNQLMKWASQPRKRFPWCKKHGCQMYAAPLVENSVPDEVNEYLIKYELPYLVVNRYVCPRGRCQMWYIPQRSNTAEDLMVVHYK